MDQLQLREKEIFETLKKIKLLKFVLIGGYAVNTYTLPRFSVDCDIVIGSKTELKKIESKLIKMDYKKETANKHIVPYDGKFRRYEKRLENNFKVSVDVIIDKVLDRQTNATFSADWIFLNSKTRKLRGKTIQEELKVRVINIDALIAMKMSSGRGTDIRDVFMLVAQIKDKDWIKQQISERCDFNDRFSKIKEKITSKQFKDGLQGVFGYIEDNIFNKHKNLFLALNK